jgi:hypothetical protein
MLQTGTFYTVYDGARSIGTVNLFTLSGFKGWRFISNRKEVAAKMPIPATAHDTPEECFETLRGKLT